MAVVETLQRLFLADSPNAAGNALAARLITKESSDAVKNFAQVRGVVKEHDDTRPQRRTHRLCTLQGERRVQFFWRKKRSCRAPQQNGLKAPVARHAASQFNELTQG